MADFKTVQIGGRYGNPLYRHVSGAATTTVKTGPGCLHRIVVGTPAGICTVYDNTAGSGTVIAVVTLTVPGSLDFNCDFTTGLTIVTTLTSDITVIYE